MVDQYAKMEQERLNYLRLNQSTFRAEMYQGAVDAIHTGDTSNNIGRRIILPSSFTGGPRQMYQLYQDAMTIVSHFGKPDLFITFTCNPKWQEITLAIMQGEQPNDRPNIIIHVFHMKIEQLLEDIRINNNIWSYSNYFRFNRISKKGITSCSYLSLVRQKWK